MFNKRPDREPVAFEAPKMVPPMTPSGPMPQAVPTGARPPARSGQSHIGSDLTVIGNLLSQGQVQIDGEIEGDVHALGIIIGETARITGGLVAEEIVVRGTVLGSIRGRRVVLQSASRVEGDLFHSQLAIEQGAYFEGKSRRVEDPLAGIERPTVSPPNGRPA